MTLLETKETILTWIQSCKTAEQLDLILPLIVSNVIIPFEKKATELELIMVKEDLVNAITDKKMHLIKTSLPQSIPTLDSYLDDIIN